MVRSLLYTWNGSKRAGAPAGDTPKMRSRPPRLMYSKASCTTRGLPVASMTTSNPRGIVRSTTSWSAGPGVAVTSAPSVRATSRRAGLRSTAATVEAPACFTAWRSKRPMGPAPKMSTSAPGVDHAGQRLDEGSLGEAHAGRKPVGVLRRGADVFRKPPVRRVPNGPPVLAEVPPVGPAEEAPAAEQGGIDGHGVPFLHGVHPVSRGGDDARHFVARDQGVRRGGELPLVDVHVGPANPARLDRDDHLTGAGGGDGEVLHHGFPGAFQHDGFHRRFPPSSSCIPRYLMAPIVSPRTS